MYISAEDMNELKRLATNTYEQEKSNQIHRIIRGIAKMESEIRTIKEENLKLKTNS